jgi:hypothetical protein
VIDRMNTSKASKMVLYNDERFSEIKTFSGICAWLHENVSYMYDFTEYWQTPEFTVKNRMGDCEDYSILYINIAYVLFGVQASLCAVTMENAPRTIVEGGMYNHYVVLLPDGRMIEPQNGRECRYTIQYVYSFDELFTK